MTTNALFMVLAVGAFAVLCVVAWHLVLVLKQVRRTAVAVEVFLESTRPRVEAATDKLDSLMGRADRFLARIEERQGVIATVVSGITQAVAGFTTGGKVVTTISAVLAGIREAWRSVRSSGEESTAGATPAGGNHE